MPHGKIRQIVAVHRPEDGLKTGGMGLIQIMDGVHHHIIVIGHAGVASVLKLLHRICLPGGDRHHLRSRMETKGLVAEMLAEGDKADLIEHVHLLTQCDHLLRKLGFPLRSRVGLELKEKLQGGSLLRLGEILPQRRNMVAVREDAVPDGEEVKFLYVLVPRTGNHRAVQDHERVVRGEVYVKLNPLDTKSLSAGKAGQSVFKGSRMGVETPVGHNLGLRRKCHGAKQCKDCGCKELFHVAKIHIFRNRQGEQQEKTS